MEIRLGDDKSHLDELLRLSTNEIDTVQIQIRKGQKLELLCENLTIQMSCIVESAKVAVDHVWDNFKECKHVPNRREKLEQMIQTGKASLNAWVSRDENRQFICVYNFTKRNDTRIDVDYFICTLFVRMDLLMNANNLVVIRKCMEWKGEDPYFLIRFLLKKCLEKVD